MGLLMQPPWKIRSRRIWLGLGIGAVGVIVLGTVLFVRVSSTIYHAACVVGVVLLLASTAVTLAGLAAEARSSLER